MMKINPREVEWFSKDCEQLRLLTNYIDFCYFTLCPCVLHIGLFTIALYKSLSFHVQILSSHVHTHLDQKYISFYGKKGLGMLNLLSIYQFWMCYFLSLERISIRPCRDYFWRWPIKQLYSIACHTFIWCFIRPYHCCFSPNTFCALAQKVWTQSSNMQEKMKRMNISSPLTEYQALF